VSGQADQNSNRSKTMIFYIIGVVVVIAVVASYLGLHF
jgi:predicted nucleic acid-binding Zn ribbon protein